MKAKVPKQFLPFVILFFSARDWLVVVLGVVVIAAETRQVVSFYGTTKSYLGLSHPASLLLTGGGSDRYEHALHGSAGPPLLSPLLTRRIISFHSRLFWHSVVCLLLQQVPLFVRLWLCHGAFTLKKKHSGGD